MILAGDTGMPFEICECRLECAGGTPIVPVPTYGGALDGATSEVTT